MKFVIHPDFQQHTDFLRALPSRYSSYGKVLHNGRNTVRRIEHDGQVFIVKRFKRPLFFQRVAYTFFRKTKARRAYEYALRYLSLGIDTPRPIAYVEVSSWGLFSRGYFVSEEDSRPSCMHYFDEHTEGDGELQETIARKVYEMHRLGILHGDLNLGNILCEHPQGGPWHLSFIDINRSAFIVGLPSYHRTVSEMWRLTPFEQIGHPIYRIYARLRGWDEEKFVTDVSRLLTQQVKRKDRRRKLKISR